VTEGRNILVCGRTGTGKTFWTLQQLEHVERLFCYVPKLEEASYPGVYFDGRAGERPACWQWLDYSLRRCGRFRIVYHPANPWSYAEFDRVCQGIYLLGDVTFVAEDLVGYTGRADLKSDEATGFRSLLCDGRTRSIECYLLTQRPHGIPVEVRSECREARIFALNHAGDVQYIKQSFGDVTTQKLDELGQYQHVHWDEVQPPEIQGP